MTDQPERLPDAELLALRAAVETWLEDQGQFFDEDRDLAANNLTLWATSFLRLTERTADNAAETLKQQGARDFITRVLRSAESVRQRYDLDPTVTVARAFAAEVGWLNGDGQVVDGQNGGEG